MGGELFVEPSQLRAAVTEVAAATQALAAARGALEGAERAAAATLSADGHAAHKMHTFVRQYREEYRLISDMLGAFHDVLGEAAACYDELDAGTAAGLSEAGDP